jgi:hypothetical protein
MYIRRIEKIKSYLFRFFTLQLFLTAISFPILIGWGLPLSLLTFIGNLIFSPLITVFLIISSCFFFCQLLHIRSYFFAQCLEYLATIWISLLYYATPTWIISCAKPPFIILICMTAGAFYLLYRIQKKKIILLSSLMLFLIGTYCITLFFQIPNGITKIACNNGYVTFINTEKTTCLIDAGYVGKRSSSISWVKYYLIPNILQKTGSFTLDHVIVLKPTIFLFQGLQELIRKMRVKNIYIPEMTGITSSSFDATLKKLLRDAKHYNSQIHFIKNHQISVINEEKFTIDIKPLAHILSYHQATFPALSVTGYIDNMERAFYAANYNLPQPKRTQ